MYPPAKGLFRQCLSESGLIAYQTSSAYLQTATILQRRVTKSMIEKTVKMPFEQFSLVNLLFVVYLVFE